MLLVVFASALAIACAGLAYSQGSRADRIGALWFSANMAFTAIAYVAGFSSPVVQLVEDGVFALGLLPLAMIYVSYWMGLLTLVAAALFSLEAFYLLNDRPMDNLYSWINNTLWLMAPIIFLVCGLANLGKKRRAAKRERQIEAVAVGA